MLNRCRRSFLAAACATLLYGARSVLATETPAVRIALLLPLNSSAFGRVAASVRDGFAAALQFDTGAPIEVAVYATTEEVANVASAYEQALSEGARLIVGPLTRDGVSAVVVRARPGIPVLVLNVPDDAALPQNFYSFSLQVESEAKQVARMAYRDGRRRVVTLSDEQPLERRIHRAFSEEFGRLGGTIAAQFAYRTTTADLLALREAAGSGQFDSAFLALDGSRARQIRGYLQGMTHIYATSQVLEGHPDALRDAELNGIRFVGMPWLLQPDHPAVMVYARSATAAPGLADFERLYALGIDAFRLAAAIVRRGDMAPIPLDGVTGRITLRADRRFARELTAAQFIDGRPVPIARSD